MAELALREKRLLYIGNRLFITQEADLNTSVWAMLKNLGLKSLYMVLQSRTGDQVWIEQLADMGIVDVFVTERVLENWDQRPEKAVADGVIEWLQTNDLKIDACLCMSQLMRLVQAEICSSLGLLCDSVQSLKSAVSKLACQQVLCASNYSKHGVQTYAVTSKEELLGALHHLSFPVIMKPSYGGGSSGCKLLNNASDCERHLVNLTRDMKSGGEFCQKIVYSHEVVVMPYIRGTKYSVDVAIAKGKFLGGFVAERGPAPVPYFHATELSMPGCLPLERQEELIEAAFTCCRAVGLHNGIYDVDLVWEEEGCPKLLEINPRPPGNALKDLAKTVYGADMFVLNAILSCGIDKLGTMFGTFTPKCSGFAILPYLLYNGDALRRSAKKMVSLSKSHGVTLAYPGRMNLVDFVESGAKYEYPPVVVCAFADSLNQARAKVARFLLETGYHQNVDEFRV